MHRVYHGEYIHLPRPVGGHGAVGDSDHDGGAPCGGLPRSGAEFERYLKYLVGKPPARSTPPQAILKYLSKFMIVLIHD